jgi:hypothetical protein
VQTGLLSTFEAKPGEKVSSSDAIAEKSEIILIGYASKQGWFRLLRKDYAGKHHHTGEQQRFTTDGPEVYFEVPFSGLWALEFENDGDELAEGYVETRTTFR